jgi:hypothetical protein
LRSNYDRRVLKIDTKGRVRRTLAQRVAIPSEFGRSGPRFAAVAGIKLKTLVGWRRKHRQVDASGSLEQGNCADTV